MKGCICLSKYLIYYT